MLWSNDIIIHCNSTYNESYNDARYIFLYYPGDYVTAIFLVFLVAWRIHNYWTFLQRWYLHRMNTVQYAVSHTLNHISFRKPSTDLWCESVDTAAIKMSKFMLKYDSFSDHNERICLKSWNELLDIWYECSNSYQMLNFDRSEVRKFPFNNSLIWQTRYYTIQFER